MLHGTAEAIFCVTGCGKFDDRHAQVAVRDVDPVVDVLGRDRLIEPELLVVDLLECLGVDRGCVARGGHLRESTRHGVTRDRVSG